MRLLSQGFPLVMFWVGLGLGLSFGYFNIFSSRPSCSSASTFSEPAFPSPPTVTLREYEPPTTALPHHPPLQKHMPLQAQMSASIVSQLQAYLDESRGGAPSLPYLSPPGTPPKVFGLGLSKTGTTSLKEALQVLGVNCHKQTGIMNDVFTSRHQPFSIDVIRRFDQLESVTDLPLPYFFEELAFIYPDAKFVLTVRDPASWWRSFEAHIERNKISSSGSTEGVRQNLRILHYGGVNPSQYVAVKAFLRHNQLVQSLIPPERLLVLDVAKEGETGEAFAKLCRFLGVAESKCPSGAFPHANQMPSRQKNEGLREGRDGRRGRDEDDDDI
ncbi:Sulfotransferase family protein [Balamuthia mandrillaris]